MTTRIRLARSRGIFPASLALSRYYFAFLTLIAQMGVTPESGFRAQAKRGRTWMFNLLTATPLATIGHQFHLKIIVIRRSHRIGTTPSQAKMNPAVSTSFPPARERRKTND